MQTPHSQSVLPSPRREVGALLRLAGPLIANNLAIAGMNFADTVMAGRLGAGDLAAVAVGGSVWMPGFLFAMGVILAISPTTAHNYGARRELDVGKYTRQSVWIAIGFSLIVVFAMTHVDSLLHWVGTDKSIIPLTQKYINAMMWGAPAICAYLSLRFTTEGLGRTRPIMFIALLGLVVNVAGNYVLMYGKLGFPAMGAVGCGYASAVAMWTMFFAMAHHMNREPFYRPFKLFERFDWPDRQKTRELLGLGLPIGVSFVAEAGLFSVVSLMMSTFGAAVVAGHQIAINYAATMFMIPLGLHSAATIRIGQAIGRGQPHLAMRTSWVAIATCAVIMSVSAVVMLLAREMIVGLYTADTEVAAMAYSLLFIAAVFQVSDGLQIGAAGVLRGYKDTKIPMFMNFFAYWMVGFPLAYYLGMHLQKGAITIWVGLVVGLTVCALLLNTRVWIVSRLAMNNTAGAPEATSPGAA